MWSGVKLGLGVSILAKPKFSKNRGMKFLKIGAKIGAISGFWDKNWSFVQTKFDRSGMKRQILGHRTRRGFFTDHQIRD